MFRLAQALRIRWTKVKAAAGAARETGAAL
jgi:hypothetical protein